MAPYFQLDLDTLPIDAQLARRLPYALARYYMALPLGQDGDCISVAMAYPENVRARQTLSRLLQAEIVAVFTPAESLLPALERVYPPQSATNRAILAWYDEPGGEAAITATSGWMEGLLQARATVLNASELCLDELLAMATPNRFELVVLPIPDRRTLPAVLQRAAVPLLFVRGEQRNVGRILVVMRGFASDEQAMNWLALFAGQQASVTLMPLTNGTGLGLSEYYHQETPAGQHLERCLRRLATEGESASLTFRQGDAVQQVVEEMTGSNYDLLVVAAEAEGDFVGRVIAALEQRRSEHAGPILVLEPPELPAERPMAESLATRGGRRE